MHSPFFRAGFLPARRGHSLFWTTARPRLKPMVLAVYLGCAVLALAAPHADVMAQTTERAYDIPAGSLASALNRFAQQSGVSIAVDDKQLAGLKSAGLKGSFGVEDGFAELLKGSGYGIGKTSAGYVLVQAERSTAVISRAGGAADKELPEVRVRARREANGTTEGTGSYTSRITSIASKTDQSFREIPQSVSVITRQQIDDQHYIDINDAMNATPGITAKRVNQNAFDFYSRGFKIDSMQVDGGAPLNISSFTFSTVQDLAFYDRVEVMRGASGLLTGAGDPGGVVNMVRKKPLATPQVTWTSSIGTWSNYRSELDMTGPIAYDGKIRGRAVLVYENKNSFRDFNQSEKSMAYGVLETDLSRNTLLTLGGSYGRMNTEGDSGGLPRYSNGADIGLPRSANLTQPWSGNEFTLSEAFAQLEHRFANQWKLKLNLSHSSQDRTARGAFSYGAIDPVTRSGASWAGTQVVSSNTQDLVDLNVAGNFALLGRTHELMFGADWQRIRSSWQSRPIEGQFATPINVFNPAATPWSYAISYDWSDLYSPWGQEQYGAYGAVRLHPTDRLHVVMGARAARYKFDQMTTEADSDGVWSLTSQSNFSEPTKVTPYAGVIYDLNEKWSTYVSYSTIYKPQATYKAGPPPGGASLPAITGKSYEAGFKGELMDGRANATFSVFYVTRNGEAVLDPAYPSTFDPYSGSCCYRSRGEVVSRGFDAEIGGEVLPGLELAAGYTFNTTLNKESNLPYSSITPKHLFKLSTAYRLSGELSRWKIGGGLTAQSVNYVSGTAVDGGVSTNYNFTQGGYALLNAMVQYQVDPRWLLSLNIYNVTDRVYYEKVGTTTNGNWYGSPRNAVLSLRGSF